MKRIKKPPVKPEQRQEWLKRYELGDSPPKIAASDDYDVRTVRTHIERAKQEREVKDARATVLRSALERHYADMCDLAERLNPQAYGKTADWSSYDEHLKAALRQHLPRSPIWGYLSKRNDLLQQISQLTDEATRKIEGVRADRRLSHFDDQLTAVKNGIIDFLNNQMKEWAEGRPGLNLKGSEVWERTSEEGLFEYCHGGFHMGQIRKDEAPIIDSVLEKWQSRIRQWEGYKKLGKCFTDMKRVENNLSDELSVITLRRIVPGRCRYCPI